MLVVDIVSELFFFSLLVAYAMSVSYTLPFLLFISFNIYFLQCVLRIMFNMEKYCNIADCLACFL